VAGARCIDPGRLEGIGLGSKAMPVGWAVRSRRPLELWRVTQGENSRLRGECSGPVGAPVKQGDSSRLRGKCNGPAGAPSALLEPWPRRGVRSPLAWPWGTGYTVGAVVVATNIRAEPAGVAWPAGGAVRGGSPLGLGVIPGADSSLMGPEEALPTAGACWERSAMGAGAS